MRSDRLNSCRTLFPAIFVLSLIASVFSCAGDKSQARLDPAWIQGLTQGETSRAAPVRVLFAKPLGQHIPAEGILHTRPAIEGSAVWIDDFTLEFTPKELLPPQTRYRASLTLPQQSPGEKIPELAFSFFTPSIEASTQHLTLMCEDPSKPEEAIVRGEIAFSDVMLADEIDGLLNASLGSSKLPVRLESAERGRLFSFQVGGLTREDHEQNLAFSLSGKKGLLSQDAHARMRVPAKGDFSVLDIRPRSYDDTVIEVVFSQPLKEDQDLRGLIGANNGQDDGSLRFAVRNNLLRVYRSDAWPTSFDFNVHPGIQSALGQVLLAASTRSIQLPKERPELRFVGKGTIIPDAGRCYIPIETRNLKAVMVRALHVPDVMMHQFMQNNKLTELNEMNRVASVVWEKTMDLPWKDEYADQFVKHGLDVSELAKDHKGGLYYLVLSFRRPHIVYDTDKDFSGDEVRFERWPDGPDFKPERSNWDWYEYNKLRQFRFDPTNEAFYMPWQDHNITKGRTVLVSNIGIMAQLGSDNTLNVQATSLSGAAPLASATVEVLGYQQQVLAGGKTDKLGQFSALVPAYPAPYSVRVRNGSDIGYLRMRDQDALNISHFDVGGERDEIDVQGYIYGERDVWRPGDTVHLVFVLRDTKDSLPDNHPVNFEVRDPRGTKLYATTSTMGLDGMYYFPFETAPDAPTGSYQVLVEVGGHRFERAVRIETVIPNRLKIEMSLDKKDGLLRADAITGSLFSQWLHGGSAGNLKAEVDLKVSSAHTSFNRFKDFVFDDPTRTAPRDTIRLLNSELDEEGRAAIDSSVNFENAPGMLNATFITRVYEPGGSFSTEYHTELLSPYTAYAGMRVPPGDAARGMLLTDIDHKLEIALVDPSGAPVSGKVQAELHKLTWQWWWETDSTNNAGFYNKQSSSPLKTQTVNVKDGKGSFTFRTNYPDWGRYLLSVTSLESGHRSTRVIYLDWPGWAGRAMDGPGDAPEVLTFTADKKSYAVGETATLNLPLGKTGRARVTIEANGAIIKSDWVSAAGAESRYRFTVSADMLPNMYAHVTYIQPWDSGNDRPLRSHGVIPLAVSDPSTELTPVITSPEVIEPGSEIEIRVTEASGRAMNYTLAVVDEGLLGLTRYETPRLHTRFYRRTASLLKAFDLYGDVAGAVEGQLASLLAIGGGGDAAGQGGEKVARFKPVVLFEAPRRLEAGKENVHRLRIPDYLGAVRVMVVAVDQGKVDAYGRAERTVVVRKPLMVLATVPRLVSPGDEFDVPVSIFALEESINKVNVTLTTEGSVFMKDTHQLVSFDRPGEKTLLFRAKIGDSIGTVRFLVTAQSNMQIARHEIPLEVRMPTAPETVVQSVMLPAGGRQMVLANLSGIVGTNELSVECSSMEPVNMEKRLGYLIRYPYGCLEQTTSSGFPQLFLPDVLELDESRRTIITDNINRTIERIQLFQTSSGGFTFWPGSGSVNDWVSSYAGHFLVEAKRKGFRVPEELMQAWLNYQKERANAASIYNQAAISDQVYRLYTLSLAGQPEMAAMNRLLNRTGGTLADWATTWQLAAAYSLAGNKDQAAILLRNPATDILNYQGNGALLGSRYRDRALMANAMLVMGYDAMAFPLVRGIARDLSSDAHYSTQETAFMLMAVSRFMASRDSAGFIDVNARIDGADYPIKGNRSVVLTELPVKARGTHVINLENRGKNDSWVQVITRGNPLIDKESSSLNGYRLELGYEIDGKSVNELETIAAGSPLRVVMRVTNTTNRALEHTALAYLIPCGFELVNSRLARAPRNTRLDYQDIRDDRVNSFFTLPAGESLQLDLELIATYSGRFYAPGVLVEAMYEPAIMARSKGSWVEVVRSAP